MRLTDFKSIRLAFSTEATQERQDGQNPNPACDGGQDAVEIIAKRKGYDGEGDDAECANELKVH